MNFGSTLGMNFSIPLNCYRVPHFLFGSNPFVSFGEKYLSVTMSIYDDGQNLLKIFFLLVDLEQFAICEKIFSIFIVLQEKKGCRRSLVECYGL